MTARYHPTNPLTHLLPIAEGKPMKTVVIPLLAAAFSLARPVFAQTGYPMVMSLKPIAVQAGKESEVEFNSRYSMLGAFQVLSTGDGLKGTVQHPEVKPGEKPELTKMKVKFAADASALPGVRDVKIATPQGVSTVGQIVVVSDPVIVEASKNDDISQAQEVALPATLCGCLEKAEDLDFFKFKVEAGTELHFHMRCARLQDRIHDLQNHCDPMITLRNSAGSTIAASDNFFFGDPFVSHRFEHAGEYTLEVRDVRYEGNPYWEYAIEVSSKPFVTNLFPFGVAIGQETPLKLIGTQLPQPSVLPFKLATDTPVGASWARLSYGNELTNPAPIYATNLPVVMEQDTPNDAPETAQLVTLPVGINGRVSQESDVDCFKFEAKKGDKFTFEVRARRYQSALDSNLRILNDKGAVLQENDDLRDLKRGSSDSRIENWAVPADGIYTVEVRDMHLRGGESFVYFLEVTKAEPHFKIYADTDKTLLGPGGSGVVFVKIDRRNGFDGEVQLHVDGLPSNVTATCGRILAGKNDDGCIIFKAASDAVLSATNVTIRGTSTLKLSDTESRDLASVAGVYQETYQPGGGRGHWPVETHTLSIGAPADIRAVKLSDKDSSMKTIDGGGYEVTLKPGETKTIEVTIDRAEGFDKNVTLDVMFQHLGIFANTLPPGVKFDEGKSSKLITGKNVKGHVVITADANAAPVERQLIPVTANVSLNFVMKTTFSAEPLWLTIVKP